MAIVHKSVLVEEVLTALDPQPNKLYIDATFGSGGHTRAILERQPQCRVVALDWDLKSIETFASPLQEQFGERFQVVWGNFAQLHKVLKAVGITAFDGILADFGTSQMQIFEREGFSFSVDTPLDMRMSPAHQLMTAADVVNQLPAQQLADIFYELAQEHRSRQIAKAIVEHRRKKRFKTTADLVGVIASVVPVMPYQRIHPATKVFQALRMFVNKELENISSFLNASFDMLNPDGRLVCISFHSLEDRLVKEFIRSHPCNPVEKGFENLTKKVIMAGPAESKANPSARSARLRAARLCPPGV